MTQPSLFDVDPAAIQPTPADPLAGLSTRRRLTVRQFTDLQMRVHPVTKRPLRADAPVASNKCATGPRCGSCVHLFGHEFRFLKCGAANRRYATRGQASDIRKWWPACDLYQSTDQT